jgi:hypothetical protein
MFYLLLVAATLVTIVLIEMIAEMLLYRKAAKDAEAAYGAALERAVRVVQSSKDSERTSLPQTIATKMTNDDVVS